MKTKILGLNAPSDTLQLGKSGNKIYSIEGDKPENTFGNHGDLCLTRTSPYFIYKRNGNKWKTIIEKSLNTYRVSPDGGDFQHIADAITYLTEISEALENPQMDGIRLVVDSGHYDITDTIVIDLNFPLAIEGSGSNVTFCEASTGLTNKPMFEVHSDTYFHKISFHGDTLTDWGTLDTEKCIIMKENGIYCEVVDFFIHTAYTGICCKYAADIFVYNFTIEETSVAIGFDVDQTIPNIGGSLDIEVGDFNNCTWDIYLNEGAEVSVLLYNLDFNHDNSNQYAIYYVGSTFSYNKFYIASCSFNGVGNFLSGFDFTLKRDADIIVQDLINAANYYPYAKINTVDDNNIVTVTTDGTYYKAAFVNTNSTACKFYIANNRITYLSTLKCNLVCWIDGTISANSNNRSLSVGLRKNGTGSIISPMTVRCQTSGQAYAFGMSILLLDLQEDDYFEIFVTSDISNTEVVIPNITWYTQKQI